MHTNRDAVAWAREAGERGAGEVLLTSFDRDGTRQGYDLELIAAVAGAVRVPVIASGGASHPGHLVEALCAGADAVLAASIFHEREFTVASVKEALAAAGFEVRR
jgi:cyclase